MKYTAQHRSGTVLLMLAVLACVPIACDSDSSGPDEVQVTVMTRNLYLGADIFVLFENPDNQPIPVLVAQLYGAVQASNFAERAQAIADEIEAADPALVGLQEVALYRVQETSDYVTGTTTPNATEVTLDFLTMLAQALEDQGLDYRVAGGTQNADVELPATTDGQTIFDVRFTDRDIILARGDVETEVVAEDNFQAALPIPLGESAQADTIRFLRGYNIVDATVEDVTFTFANAHLEVGAGEAGAVQQLQAEALVQTLDSISAPIVVVGDFNSPADGSGTDSYAQLTQIFTDVFAVVGTGDGFTCCQALDLTNDNSALYERIDLILYSDDIEAVSVDVVGEDPADRTDAGRWPSDHAGVVATLAIEN